ncbi:hypothetical protein CapIbe_005559 [Capra ibex]
MLVLPYLKHVNGEVSKTMWMQGKNIKICKSEICQKVTPSGSDQLQLKIHLIHKQFWMQADKESRKKNLEDVPKLTLFLQSVFGSSDSKLTIS